MATKELFRTALGREPGETRALQFGYNPAVGNGAVETVWDAGGMRAYDSSATTMYVSSSSTNDNGTSSPVGSGATSVAIEGLNASWESLTQIVTLNGQTGVEVPVKLIRVRSITQLTGGANAGDLYVSIEASPTIGVPAAGNIRAKAIVSHGASLTGAYSVPSGKTALLLNISAFGGKGDDLTGDIYIRPFGGIFTIGGKINIFESTPEIPLRATVPLQEKTDIEIRAIASTQNTKMSVFMELLLFDNMGV